MSDDPPRWLEGGEPFLQSLLEAGRTELPDTARMEQLAAKLGPAILAGGGTGGTGGAAATKASLWSSTLAKAIGAAVVTGGVIVTAVVVRSAPEPVAVPADEPVTIAPPEPVQSAPIREAEPVAPAASAAAPIAVVPSIRPAPVAPAEDAEEETRLLHRAQDELGGSPARALATCQEHQRRFPRGILAQEREVLAIDALVRLGRQGEATRRAETFARSYPSSSHRRRVEALLSAP